MQKLCLLCALFTTIPAFSENPDGAAESHALDAIRQYAANYIHSLPDFTCTQVTTRTYWPDQRRRLNPRHDAIEEQLTFSHQKETYTVLLINGERPNSASHDQLQGISSTGEFGTLLSRTLDANSNGEFR